MVGLGFVVEKAQALKYLGRGMGKGLSWSIVDDHLDHVPGLGCGHSPFGRDGAKVARGGSWRVINWGRRRRLEDCFHIGPQISSRVEDFRLVLRYEDAKCVVDSVVVVADTGKPYHDA